MYSEWHVRNNDLLPQLMDSLLLLFPPLGQSGRRICGLSPPAGPASGHLSGPPCHATPCASPWAASSAGRARSASGSPLPASPSAAAWAVRFPLTFDKPVRIETFLPSSSCCDSASSASEGFSYLPLRLLQSWTGLLCRGSALLAPLLSRPVELLLQSVLLLLGLKQLQLQAALWTLGMLGNLAQLGGIQALQLLHLFLPQTLFPFKDLQCGHRTRVGLQKGKRADGEKVGEEQTQWVTWAMAPSLSSKFRFICVSSCSFSTRRSSRSRTWKKMCINQRATCRPSI